MSRTTYTKVLSRHTFVCVCVCGIGAVSATPLAAQNSGGHETAGSLWVAANRAAAAGDHEEEQRLMARASALAPQHPAPLYGLARADALTGRTDEALRILDQLAAMGFSRFDPADSAFRPLFHDRRYASVVACFAENRLPIISSDTAFVVPGTDRIPENIAYDPRGHAFYIGSLAQHTVIRIGTGGDTSRIAGPEDGLLRVVGMKVDTSRNRLWVATWGAATASIDGLYWYRGNLIGVQMARSVERIVRFTIDRTGSRVLGAEVLERSHPAFRFPTTGVIVRDSLYYIANPGWDRLEDDGRIQPADTPSPTIILRLPLR